MGHGRMMLAGVLMVWLAGVGWGWAAGYDLPVSGQALVHLLEGHADRVTRDSRVPLHVQDVLHAPVKIVVGEDSRLELLLGDGSFIRFAPRTTFTLVRADAVADTSRDISVDVALGDCWAKVQALLGGEGSFEVNSPTVVAGVAGTVYRLHVEPDASSRYVVYDGAIKVTYAPVSPPAGSGPMTRPHRVEGPSRVPGPHRVSLKEWMVVVAKGYSFAISPWGTFDQPEPFDMDAERQNPWVAWNLERDGILSFE